MIVICVWCFAVVGFDCFVDFGLFSVCLMCLLFISCYLVGILINLLMVELLVVFCYVSCA